MAKSNKIYDLEERTKLFAKDVRLFLARLPKTTSNYEDSKQLARSSGSVGANYIEANESLGEKDFIMRIKISRKEAKESAYWLDLLDVGNSVEVNEERELLRNEARELMMIFSSIMHKVVSKS